MRRRDVMTSAAAALATSAEPVRSIAQASADNQWPLPPGSGVRMIENSFIRPPRRNA